MGINHSGTMPLKFEGWPFLTVINSSDRFQWNGVQVVHFKLEPVDRDTMPYLYIPNYLIQIHLGGKPNQLEFSFPKQGSGGISTPGTLFLYPINQNLKSAWTEPSENFTFSITEQLLRNVAADTVHGDPDRVEIISKSLFRDSTLSSYGHMLLYLLYHPYIEAHMSAEHLGISIAKHLLENYSAHRGRRIAAPQRADQQMKLAMDFMHVYYPRNLSTEEIAHHCGFSATHFHRLFQKSNGLTPHKYLMKIRLENAHQLLKQRRHTVAEVAEMVGFYDQSHLNRQFKRKYGISPREMLM
jgi:AraC family transcriptional regulator